MTMKLDAKGLEAAARDDALSFAGSHYRKLDEVLSYAQDHWRRHLDECEKVIRAYLNATHSPATDAVSLTARFARLSGIVGRLRWTDVGVPAMNHQGTKDALDELAQYLFAEGLAASPPARMPTQENR